MKKLLLALVAVAVLAAIWLFLSKDTPTVTAPTGTAEEMIVEELDTINLGDLDTEFGAIDGELNQL